MASGIDGDPNDYDFGLNFNYELWNSDTTITLANVGWDSAYVHTVPFPSRGALNAYLDSVSSTNTRIGNVSYARVNMPVRLNVPFNVATRYNYLRASNPVQPVPGGDYQRDWYYFIADVNYIAPNTTEFVVQLDIFQSYYYDVNFGNAFVDRSHVGVANENNFDNYGRDYLTEPEGMDIGTGYRVISKRDEFVAGIVDMSAPQNTIRQGYSILALSAIDLNGDPGTEDAPNRPVAGGGSIGGIIAGAGVYIWESVSDFRAFLSAYKSLPWMTDGILSITLIPHVRRYVDPPYIKDEDTRAINIEINSEPLKHQMYNGWRESAEILASIFPRYRQFKKFLTFPYMLIEATTFSDTPLILKPEEWPDDNATMVERASFMPPNQRVAFSPLFYNAAENATEDDWTRSPVGVDGGGDDHGEFMDMTTQITSFPKTSVVNDQAITALASTVHTRNAQRAGAYWSRLSSQRGASTATANDVTSQVAESERVQRQNKFNRQQAAREAAQAGDARNIDLLSGGMLNPVGAGRSAWQGQHQARAATENVSASNALASTQRNADAFTAAEIRDRNASLAEFAAQGDFENTIGNIQAAKEDAEMIAPSVSGQMGGETLMMSQNNMKLSLRFKLIDNAAIRRIGEHWIRYGYAVNQYVSIPESLLVMTRFTYWRTTNIFIGRSPMPESHKYAFKGIFEKGVTVWADPDRIGNYDDNQPLAGVSI